MKNSECQAEYAERSYRKYTSTDGLVSFSVSIKETDLFISASKYLKNEAEQAVLHVRRLIENHIKKKPEFSTSLTPLPCDNNAHPVIKKMIESSSAAGVGPMAAVAGAVAEHTGIELLKLSDEVIVENGGDIFLKVERPITIGIFAGESPLSEQIGIKIDSVCKPFSICTSSGSVGPSLSFGKADSVTIKSSSAPHADAAATAIGNMIMQNSDIKKCLNISRNMPLIDGALLIKGKHLGVWGDMELTSL